MARFDGLAEFVTARERALMRSAYLLTGDAFLAEDLVQSALLKVAPRWRRVTASGDPEAYVRKILYREHVSWWRRRGRHGDVLSAAPPEGEGQPDFADGAVSSMVLRQALARLTAPQRAVIVLRFYEDCSVAETAELLGCTTGTVKSQTHRALARLRELEPGLAGLLSEAENEEANQ